MSEQNFATISFADGAFSYGSEAPFCNQCSSPLSITSTAVVSAPTHPSKKQAIHEEEEKSSRAALEEMRDFHQSVRDARHRKRD